MTHDRDVAQGKPVAWRTKYNPNDEQWQYFEFEPEGNYEVQPLYAAPPHVPVVSAEWTAQVDAALIDLGAATTQTEIDSIRRWDAHMRVANFLHSIRLRSPAGRKP